MMMMMKIKKHSIFSSFIGSHAFVGEPHVGARRPKTQRLSAIFSIQVWCTHDAH